jgi:hypothetical protein
MAKYTLITGASLQTRLDKRYEGEISSLRSLGFRQLAYILEDHGPFSALSQLLVIPLALSKGEILVFKWPFRLASANVLLSTQNPASMALCMGMGIKFYSGFSDETVIITSNFVSSAIPSADSKITRLPPQHSLQATWDSHKTAANQRLQAIEPLAEIMRFEHYVKMSAIEEDMSQYALR